MPFLLLFFESSLRFNLIFLIFPFSSHKSDFCLQHSEIPHRKSMSMSMSIALDVYVLAGVMVDFKIVWLGSFLSQLRRTREYNLDPKEMKSDVNCFIFDASSKESFVYVQKYYEVGPSFLAQSSLHGGLALVNPNFMTFFGYFSSHSAIRCTLEADPCPVYLWQQRRISFRTMADSWRKSSSFAMIRAYCLPISFPWTLPVCLRTFTSSLPPWPLIGDFFLRQKILFSREKIILSMDGVFFRGAKTRFRVPQFGPGQGSIRLVQLTFELSAVFGTLFWWKSIIRMRKPSI